MKCSCIIFIFIVVTDVADFISDWLFFHDVDIAEKGLVYGPPEDAVKRCLLAFSIIGTITFILEGINLLKEICHGDPCLDSDYLSAVVIWIEDIPQAAISLYLALCREEPISVFQLTKAAVILISAVIRAIITWVQYCRKDDEQRHCKTKGVIVFGTLLEIACAVAIFVFTQAEKSADGSVSFRVPTTVIEDTYNDQRYFANVSVFLHHGQFFDANKLDTDKTDTVVNWLRLASLNNIRWQDGGEASFRMDYELKSSGNHKLAILEKYDQDSAWTWTECYEIDTKTGQISEKTNTTCSSPGYFSAASKLVMRFQHKGPGAVFKKQVFGDLHFNVREQLAGGDCQDFSNFTDSIQESTDNNIPLTFHYYRTNATLLPNNTRHLLNDTASSSFRFFQNAQPDLEDVQDIWRTGWLGCESTGNVGPTLDRGLDIDCN